MSIVPITAGILFAFTVSASAQSLPRISAPVSKSNLVTLRGNTLPIANAQHDLGRVPDGTATGRLMLVLQHSPEQQTALDKLIAAQQTSGSSSFHKWLKPSDYAAQFGVADSDIQTVTNFLSDEGFTVSKVLPNKMAIEFSGTTGQLRSTFKTEIHSFTANGQKFLANDRDPQIPAALAPVVRGFASLNNYHSRSQAPAPVKVTGILRKSSVHPLYTDPVLDEFNVSPGDIAAIYNIPTTATGAGVSIGVVNSSNVNLSYLNNYQTTFGLKAHYPNVVIDGDDPGETSNEIDGIEQLELLSAVAPDATLYYYTSASGAAEDGVTDGINFAIIRAIDDDLVQVLLYDYESCEANLGTTGTAFTDEVAEQAATEGISVIAASGNGGSDSCQSSSGYGSTGLVATATEGLSVNGYASTPYVTAVGATDFYYSNPTETGVLAYWNTDNSGTAGYTSAKGYIPEQPWNLSDGATNVYGSDNVVAATGGGVSTLGDSNGNTTAAGPYPIPSWQLPVLPASLASAGGRVIPDVSIFGGNGQNGSSYIMCAAADECVNSSPSSIVYELAGGTSVAASTFAGIAALVIQSHGAQGNLNPTLYSLFQSANASSIFHAMQTGTNTVACSAGTPNCGGSGFLVDSAGSLAYSAGAGYNAAAGLGSVDVKNLIADWKVPFTHPTTTTFTITNQGSTTPITTFVHGSYVQGNVTVTSAVGTPSGDVAIISTSPLPNNKVPTWYTLSNGAVTDDYYLSILPGGTYQVSAHYAATGAYAASASTPFTITVTPESSVIQLINENFTPGSTVTYGTSISVGASVFSATNSNSIGLPTGVVDVYDNGTLLTAVPIDDTGLATFTAQLPAGSHSLTFSYPGDASYNASPTTAAVAVTVGSQATSTTLTSSSSNDPAGSYVELVATVSSSAGAKTGIGPTGTVTFSTVGANPATLGSVTVSPGANSAGVLAGLASYRLAGTYLTGPKNTGVQAVFTPANSSYAASTSATLPLTTTKTGGKTLSTTTLATADGSASYFDYSASIGFSLKVAAKSGTGATPTGTVSVFANGSLLGTGTLSSGAVTITIPQDQNTGYLDAPFALGKDLITAQYSGDATYGASTAEIAITILDEASLPDFSIQSNVTHGTLTSTSSSAPFTLLFTSLNNFAALGQNVALTATLPTGISCSFANTHVTFATTSNYATDTYTCTETKTLAAGTYSVVVRATANEATKGQANTTFKQTHTLLLQIYVP
jgi:subtilase family serine protease